MTNSKRLRELIEDKGLKYSYVAESIGLTYQGLINKIDNVREFKTSEVNKLCEILGITSLKEKERIFFAPKVD